MVFENCLFWFLVSLQKWLKRISCLYKRLEKLSEINTSESEKWSFSSTFLIRVWFQGYRCKAGVEISACRVTWNYGYSPFKLILLLHFFFSSFKKLWREYNDVWMCAVDSNGVFYDRCKNKTETLNCYSRQHLWIFNVKGIHCIF